MTTAATIAADRPLLTRPFLGWLSAAAVAAVGDGVLYFAFGWVATGYGARTAGWLLSLALFPRILFMLVGGALGDRWGLRTTLQRTQTGTLFVLALVALTETLVDGSVATLALLALGLGVVSAVGYPAAGAYPRLFADDDRLPRLMSTVSTVLQTARFLGPPAGGLVVAAAGLVGGLIFAAVTAAVLLAALLLVRPPRPDTPQPGQGSVRAGLAAARTTPGMVSLLGAVALVAGTLLPLLSLSVPLLGRRHGWGVVGTGMVESAWVLGSIAVTLVVARRGSAPRPVVPLVAGPVVAGAAVVVIAVAAPLALALAAALVMGDLHGARLPARRTTHAGRHARAVPGPGRGRPGRTDPGGDRGARRCRRLGGRRAGDGADRSGVRAGGTARRSERVAALGGALRALAVRQGVTPCTASASSGDVGSPPPGRTSRWR